LKKKVEKWQEPPPSKLPKPLTAPDTGPKKHRGGERQRKIKAKFAMTELRKAQNRVAFGVESTDETGRSLDLSKSNSGLGKVRASLQSFAKKNTQSQLQNNNKSKHIHGTSGNTHGLSSSLAFTPVQGLELYTPKAAEENQSSVGKYFGSSFKKPELTNNK